MKKIFWEKTFRWKLLLFIYFIFIYNFTYATDSQADKWNTSSIFSFFTSDMLMNVFLAIFILIFTFFLAKFFSSRMTKYMESKYSWWVTWKEEMIWVVTRTINLVILFVWFIISLSVLWLDTSIFLWWLWIGIWFTLKIFLTNFISWVLMVTQWTYHNWDLIEIESKTWNIERIYSLYTSIRQYDWIIIYVPNVKFLQENVSNYHSNVRRRIDLEVWIDYDSDIVKAKKVMMQVVDQFPNILKNPEPLITVDRLDDGAITLVLRFWIDSKNWKYLRTKSNVTETINLAFSQSWIVMPYPQLTLSNRSDFMQNLGKK